MEGLLYPLPLQALCGSSGGGRRRSGGTSPKCCRLCPWLHEHSPASGRTSASASAFMHKWDLQSASHLWKPTAPGSRAWRGVSGQTRHLKKMRASPCMHPMQEEAEAFTEEMDRAASRRQWATNQPYWPPGAALPITVYPVRSK